MDILTDLHTKNMGQFVVMLRRHRVEPRVTIENLVSVKCTWRDVQRPAAVVVVVVVAWQLWFSGMLLSFHSQMSFVVVFDWWRSITVCRFFRIKANTRAAWVLCVVCVCKWLVFPLCLPYKQIGPACSHVVILSRRRNTNDTRRKSVSRVPTDESRRENPTQKKTTKTHIWQLLHFGPLEFFILLFSWRDTVISKACCVCEGRVFPSTETLRFFINRATTPLISILGGC